jgi:DNA-binding NtrC family response regulator
MRPASKSVTPDARTQRAEVVFAPIMQSAVMRELNQVLGAVAPKEVTVTFVGESGTGKEILARRVHDLSPRRTGPFVPINCAAIPETLFESELFGHERGSFTGASERVKGKVEAAKGGTLFLDEVGEMPLAVQAKLLRFLENRRFMRVGGSTKIEADVRLVFATLRALDEEVRGGRFRGDLYYRIQGITIDVPPLRDRRGDIAPLIAQFMNQLSARHGNDPPRLTRAARASLVAYGWPGNVRELRNVIEMMCLLRAGKPVRVRDLPAPLRRAAALSADGAANLSSKSLLIDLEAPLARNVERIVGATLELDGGNRARAAQRLGVNVRTVQRYLKSGAIVFSVAHASRRNAAG